MILSATTTVVVVVVVIVIIIIIIIIIMNKMPREIRNRSITGACLNASAWPSY